MQIKIDSINLNGIKKHGEEEYPHECCGFLIGETSEDLKSVVKIHPVENSRDTENRHNRYLITPQEFLKAERKARGEGLHIIGFYHSHPNAEARPSQYDLDYSWPVYSYLIVSVKKGEAKEATSWLIKDDRSDFMQEKLFVEDLLVEKE